MIGVDQYGVVYYLPPKYPRKHLLERLDRKHADRMYIDRVAGPAVHVGYIIARRWITLYRAWERPV